MNRQHKPQAIPEWAHLKENLEDRDSKWEIRKMGINDGRLEI
jgi:hypothetical protein